MCDSFTREFHLDLPGKYFFFLSFVLNPFLLFIHHALTYESALFLHSMSLLEPGYNSAPALDKFPYLHTFQHKHSTTRGSHTNSTRLLFLNHVKKSASSMNKSWFIFNSTYAHISSTISHSYFVSSLPLSSPRSSPPSISFSSSRPSSRLKHTFLS